MGERIHHHGVQYENIQTVVRPMLMYATGTRGNTKRTNQKNNESAKINKKCFPKRSTKE